MHGTPHTHVECTMYTKWEVSNLVHSTIKVIRIGVAFKLRSCALQNAMNTLRLDVEFSKASGFSYGVKLVRGAYMEQEKEGAIQKGATYPLWATKAETDECYDSSVEYLMTQAEGNKIHMMIATHNEDSVRKAIHM